MTNTTPTNQPPDLPVLYSFRRCPYAMRARLAIAQAGIQVELREVFLGDKPEAMLAVSPKGSVPVLVLPDHQVIDESYDVLLWALEKHDPDGWLDVDRDELNALFERTDFDFKKNLHGYKHPEWYPGKTADEYRSAALSYLSDLDQRLQVNRFIFGPKVTAADPLVLPFVRQFANVDAEWFANSPYDSLRRWLNEWLKSELFTTIMPKFDQWKDGDAPVIFPAGGE
jgi:glutathione S-transferase